ncbi:hypothetical protein AWB68_08896 [Caballeronia choica]|uniref:Uncharacterized protein n=2 Tax=Caballeronia choica TaxID=326476 RepID=A0A158L732_9BURK|nr:hypothetical protein AWB68_08896 [Caballeronia choica]
MLEIEQISHDCALGEDAFQDLQRARHFHGQRAPALRFADPKVQALLQALVMFVFVARGFTNQDLRQAYAVLQGPCARCASTRAYRRVPFAVHDFLESQPCPPDSYATDR